MSRVILLDALGTLIALEPPAPLLKGTLADRFGIDLTEAQAQSAIAAEIDYYRAHLDEGRDPRSLAKLRSRCAEALRDALQGQQRVAEIDNAALTDSLLASLRFRVFDDVGPALVAARGRSQRLVVVSNWDCSLHAVLERIGLAPLLDGVVTSAQAGARKPSPAIFERALAMAQVGPSEAIHVGDSFAEDVLGAQRAGIEPVLLRRDGAAGPAGVATIASLAELA